MVETTLKTWTIVKFLEDSSVAMVPTDWISGDNCLWPPFAMDKVTAAIKFQKIDTCWPSHKVQVFRNATYDSYEIARQKMLKAEETSDLNSTDTEGKKLTFKRKIFRKKVFSSESESEDENIQPNQRIGPKLPTPIKKQHNMEDVNLCQETRPKSAPPIKKNLIVKDVAKASSNKSETICVLAETDEEIGRKGASSLNEANQNSGRGNKKDGSGLHSSLHYQERNENHTESRNFEISTPKNKCHCYCPHHAELNAEILRQLYFLRSLTTEMNSEIKKLKSLSNEHDESLPGVMSLFKVPFNNDEELLKLNDFLKIPDNFNKMELELIRWGGSNLLDFVKRCLGLLVTDQLAVTYSWLGRRGKKAFSKMDVAGVVISAALKSGKCQERKMAENEVARWLRRAPDIE